MPTEAAARRASLDALAKYLFDALQTGTLDGALATHAELDQLLDLSGRYLVERERAQGRVRDPRQAFAAPWASAVYAGFCAQGARERESRESGGLRGMGWTLDRILVAAQHGGRRSASWLEGRFVYTPEGWKTLSLTRIEPPRPQHSDLELAPCDVEAGIR